MTPAEIAAITETARNAPFHNMNHAKAVEFLLQKLAAHFAPQVGAGLNEPTEPTVQEPDENRP